MALRKVYFYENYVLIIRSLKNADFLFYFMTQGYIKDKIVQIIVLPNKTLLHSIGTLILYTDPQKIKKVKIWYSYSSSKNSFFSQQLQQCSRSKINEKVFIYDIWLTVKKWLKFKKNVHHP